jgi:hypothetical protein
LIGQDGQPFFTEGIWFEPRNDRGIPRRRSGDPIACTSQEGAEVSPIPHRLEDRDECRLGVTEDEFGTATRHGAARFAMCISRSALRRRLRETLLH